MNAKTFLSGIAGGIVIFLAGYLIYGMLMMDYFASNMTSFPGLAKEPLELWAIGLGNIIWGILLAYILNLGGSKSWSSGALNGAFMFFLFALGMNFVGYGQWNLFNIQIIIVDSICMAVLGALSGALIGWMLGRSSVKVS